MSFFLPNQSSAATASLTEDPDALSSSSSSPIKPPEPPLLPPHRGRMAPTKPQPPARSSPTKHLFKHRRLESGDVNFLEVGEDYGVENDSSRSHDPTKSTSFSSSDSGDDCQDSDDDDSDDDETMDGYSSMPNDGLSYEDGLSHADGLSHEDGVIEDGGSVTSATTASSGTHGSLLADVMRDRNDGDLRTLNRLVNQLHAAELKREAKARRRDSRSSAASGGIGHNLSCGREDRMEHNPSPIDLPSELPVNPPRFSPLQSSHRLSISAVHSWRGPSLEVIPTEDVDGIMPLWRSQWINERLEWEERKKSLESLEKDSVFKRSRTANDAGKLGSPVGLHRRNRSMPNVGSPHAKGGYGYTLSNEVRSPHKGSHSRTRSAASIAGSSSSHRNYKYGRPPALPGAKNPNPMVERSSKRINRKHARYALTAGMMLGIRESVGGAAGVENELQVRRWEGFERWWSMEDEKAEERDERGGPNANGEAQELQLDDYTKDGRVTANCLPQDARDGYAPPSSSSSPLLRDYSPGLGFPANTIANTLTAECQRVSKYKFPPHQFYLGSNTSRPLPHKYKFKVYAPLVFARIRTLFGVEKQTFLHSICGKFNFYEFASNARSGQFFFYSHDGRYMIKTLTYVESKFLREILPHYYRHLTRHPSTFLTHFYGMYRVCMPNYASAGSSQKLHFIIMRSVFHTEKKIDRVWDLKGSRAGRRAGKGDGVGKDLDILEEGRKLRFRELGARGEFLKQLARDATFLARLGIMDYSLLLGLHNCEAEGAGAGIPPIFTPHENQGKEAAADTADTEEPVRSNTPFRRIVLQRASSAGDTKVGNDGFKALEIGSLGLTEKKSPCDLRGNGGATVARDGCANSDAHALSSALRAIPKSPPETLGLTAHMKLAPKNAITSRHDSGIEGYGARLEDGTFTKQEIYFCGLIDILQYYNARKMGETVIRKAAGNSGQDISCVDPETYGKRFVKFISNLVEE